MRGGWSRAYRQSETKNDEVQLNCRLALVFNGDTIHSLSTQGRDKGGTSRVTAAGTWTGDRGQETGPQYDVWVGVFEINTPTIVSVWAGCYYFKTTIIKKNSFSEKKMQRTN